MWFYSCTYVHTSVYMKTVFKHDVHVLYIFSDFYTTAKFLRSYNVMAQSLSSSSLSSSVEIWFPCNNFSCGWPIVMKFWYDVCNYYRKVGIDFGGCGPYRFSKRGQKGGKWVFFKNHCRMIILHVILVILFALYSWSNSVNKMCQRIWWDLDRFKVMGGSKRGNAQKINFFIFDPILKILFSLESLWKFLAVFFKQIFDNS